MIKIAGIAADNFKLDKFEEVLKKNGFSSYTIEPFTEKVSILNIHIQEHETVTIHNICMGVEIYFKQRLRSN